MVRLIIIVSLFFLFYSCNYTCQQNYVSPVFIGFLKTDIDTIVLRAYKPNDNFQHLIDTFFYHDCCATVYTTSGDSTVVYFNSSNPDHWISAGFDWQIYIPARNRTVSVSNIISPEKEGRKGCLNPIESFEQDGQLVKPNLVNTGLPQTSGYMMYIRF